MVCVLFVCCSCLQWVGGGDNPSLYGQTWKTPHTLTPRSSSSRYLEIFVLSHTAQQAMRMIRYVSANTSGGNTAGVDVVLLFYTMFFVLRSIYAMGGQPYTLKGVVGWEQPNEFAISSTTFQWDIANLSEETLPICAEWTTPTMYDIYSFLSLENIAEPHSCDMLSLCLLLFNKDVGKVFQTSFILDS